VCVGVGGLAAAVGSVQAALSLSLRGNQQVDKQVVTVCQSCPEQGCVFNVPQQDVVCWQSECCFQPHRSHRPQAFAIADFSWCKWNKLNFQQLLCYDAVILG
jgi:hypothetical protein